MSEQPKPRRGLERLADRLLLALAAAVALGAALLLWFGIVRLEAAPGGGYVALLVLLGLVGLGALAFVPLRRRIYARAPAPRLMVLALAFGLPLLAIEVLANLTDPYGYLYFAEAQRYFLWQRYEGIHVSHAHPPGGELEFPWGRITTNSEGWRGPEVATEPAPDTLRVLALGDSVVFSWGVDDGDTLPVQVERELAGRVDRLGRERVEVINGGNGSFHSVDELIVLKERGLDYRPDAVFVLVIGNDFDERPAYTDQVAFLQESGPLEPELIPVLAATAIERPPPMGPHWQPGRWAFGAISHALNRSFLLIQLARVRPVWGDRAPSGEEVGEEELLSTFPYLREHATALRELALTCRERKVPCVVFLFTRNRVLSGLPGLHPYLQRKLEGVAPVVDLAYPEGRAPQELVNSATDQHWNPEGIAWFAGLIADALRERIEAERGPK